MMKLSTPIKVTSNLGGTQNITNITRLEDLLTPEQIDGSSLTINPDKKFRKSRIITDIELAKYKRPTKIKEMLNYCKFRLGDLETCAKPSPSVLNILYSYKAGKLDRISSGYLEAIKDYKELIDNAMAIDLRKIDADKPIKQKRQRGQFKNTFIIDGLKISTHGRKDQTIRCAKNFISWLNQQEQTRPNRISEPTDYVRQIRFYSQNKKHSLLKPTIKQILDQNHWILDNYDTARDGKKLILVSKIKLDVNEKQNIIPIDTEIVKTNDKPIDNLIDNNQRSILDFNDFILKLKDIGVKEFSIKF